MDTLLLEAGWPASLLTDAKDVAWCESRFHADSESSHGARGLFQLKITWSNWAGVPFDSLFDPLVNARVAWLVYHDYDGNDWRQWQCQPQSSQP